MDTRIHSWIREKGRSRILMWAVVLISVVLYAWSLNALPLTDYDEATYAQVTVNTLESGDLLTLRRFSEPWFEKPPLYFWLAMASTKIYGMDDMAFRMPSVLLAIIGIAALWLLVRKITNDPMAATIAAIVLLASSFYYISARQVRLDIPAITTIVGSVTALAYGWSQKKWYIFVAPIIAIGFLFKSFVALLAGPVILIFSIAFRDFSWLKSKSFWFGVIIASVIIIPWHWYEMVQWGSTFWNEYIGHHILERYSGGLSEDVRRDPMGYVQLLFRHGQPWITAFCVLSIFGLWQFKNRSGEKDNRLVLSSIVSVVLIFALFAYGRTRILTYMLPLFPFVAIVIGVTLSQLIGMYQHVWQRAVLVIAFILMLGFSYQLASGKNPVTLSEMHYSFSEEEKAIGQVVAKDTNDVNFYLLAWPVHETLRYYSGREINQIPFPPTGVTLEGPWYLMVTNLQIPYFLNDDGSAKEQFENIDIRYNSGKIFLFYGEGDLDLTI